MRMLCRQAGTQLGRSELAGEQGRPGPDEAVYIPEPDRTEAFPQIGVDRARGTFEVWLPRIELARPGRGLCRCWHVVEPVPEAIEHLLL
jgi:hypothetical protein